MTADRDALALLIAPHLPSGGEGGWDYDIPEWSEEIADAILAAGYRPPLPDREHLWAQWPAEVLPDGRRRARTHFRCARCQLWYSSWHGDNDCPD